MAKKPGSKFKIISISVLAKVTAIDYFRLRNNILGVYNDKKSRGLSEVEKTEIVNALYAELQPLSEYLGADIVLKRRVR